MRNLASVNLIHADACSCERPLHCVDLKQWLALANTDDLYALYSGEVTNQTYYKLHDLLFSLHYTDMVARHFRNQILVHFKELIEGETTILKLKEDAGKTWSH